MAVGSHACELEKLPKKHKLCAMPQRFRFLCRHRYNEGKSGNQSSINTESFKPNGEAKCIGGALVKIAHQRFWGVQCGVPSWFPHTCSKKKPGHHSCSARTLYPYI